MKKSRTIFIGDVHGCYQELKLLIKRLKLKKEDKVYFVGDLINKGPDSYKVLKYLYKNKDRFKCIKGNNEINFLRWLDGDDYQEDGSFTTLNSKIKKKKTKYLIKYIKELPLYIEEKDFLLVHGGLIPNKKLEEHTKDEITRIREYNGKPWYKYYKGDKKIIYGHWALDGLQIRKNTIGLDSGCVYGKSLTAYILETGEIYSQNSLGIYIDVYNIPRKSLKEKFKNIFKKGK